MNLQRLIEQYISFQQSLGSSFTTDATNLRAFGRARGREPALPAFALSMWMLSWAKPGQ